MRETYSVDGDVEVLLTSRTDSPGQGEKPKETKEIYNLNFSFLRRFWIIFRTCLLCSVWHWLGVLALLLSAGVHSWLSSLIGEFIGKFYVVISESGNIKGIQYVIGMISSIYLLLAFEQAFTKTVTGCLSVHIRRVVTVHLSDCYFQNKSYYTVTEEKKIKNPDQQLTQDIDRYSLSYSLVLTQLTASPIFIIYFWYKVTILVNSWVPFAILGHYIISFIFQRFVMSPISHHIYQQEKLEGQFRAQHQRVKEYAESIAMLRGEMTENVLGNSIFSNTLKNKMEIIKWEFLLWFLSYTFSYGASVIGYFLIAIPILTNESLSLDFSTVATALYDMGMLAWGFTQVTIVATTFAEFSGYVHRIGEFKEVIVAASQKNRIMNSSLESSEHISFDDVTISDPKGRVLIEDINLKVTVPTLIMGPTGSGKTSIMRVLSGLWQAEGHVMLPKHIYFVPQKVYLPFGNMVQQIVYPMLGNVVDLSVEEMRSILVEVGLEDLLKRDDLHNHTNWDFLSPGQKQCLVIARLLYQSPSVVVLDEVTSHMDKQLEDKLYGLCKKKGILMLSIGHHSSLKKIHEQVFEINPQTLRLELK